MRVARQQEHFIIADTSDLVGRANRTNKITDDNRATPRVEIKAYGERRVGVEGELRKQIYAVTKGETSPHLVRPPPAPLYPPQ
jgi:hypothetical protein